ncbi:PepSY-associated TM helix domain-containing protein [Hymenobacter sp. ASUV-10]|uniref:PepSY-associated TM helix domain-containing protein n=1 Tax=Hymenobacter aranciens TaxID=3063996 RepID=A0ABT9BD93_9BACT|nr:PepSY-associated TM helix domain-containing protein [Hymenobacter sp. ASUV-10]MDO7875755.1 PepSY-associated TM helix domain-containing protein [Hymenobacter sp. ASUV-10]
MTPLKATIRTIHLWLGLATGLVLVFVCLTGCILAFEKEIEQSWHAERYFVAPATTAPLPLAQLVAAVQAAKPKAKIGGLKVYADPTRTVEISLAGGLGGKGGAGRGRPTAESPRGERLERAAGPEGPGKGKGKGGKGDAGPRLFVNPYTAAITGELNPRDNFFHTVEQLHRGLVAGPTGKLVMGINSLIFVVILTTGLVLWWPATRKALTPRLRIKWGSSWKRLNHDFHIVLGFYTAVFLLIMALTGVGMSFDWANKVLGAVTGTPLKRPEPPTSTPIGSAALAFSPDALLAWARQQAPQAQYYSLQLPKEPTGSIRVAMLPAGALTDNATDEVYLDQYSGRIISQQPYTGRNLAQRVRGLYKPIHTGAIFGLPSKVLALVVSLLGATFPITGTVMWLNRTRKSRKKQPALQPA